MEAFSLLKYWRGAASGPSRNNASTNSRPAVCSSSSATTTVITSTASPRSSNSSDNDAGPFFDLQFSLPDESDAVERKSTKKEAGDDVTEEEGVEGGESDDDEAGDINVTLSSSSSSSSCGSSNECVDSHISLSPPLPDENLFFNGHLVPIEPSSLLVTSSESNTRFPTKLLKSATKFRVMMALKFKKSKENATQKVEGQNEEEKAVHENNQKETKEGHNRKFFTVKFVKVDEVPIVSLFTRENSSKSESRKGQKVNATGNDDKDEEEKKFTKDMMQKYLKMVKPLYVRVSKRYGEKRRFSGQLASLSGRVNKASTSVAAPPASSTMEVKGGETVEVMEVSGNSNSNISLRSLRERNLTTGLRVVRKHLGKSKSASLATAGVTAQSVSRRRDDSLLQQQDGIQSAILHCKRSFNASRDVEASAEASCSSMESKVG